MAQRPAGDKSLTMLLLRVWLWAVPIAMLAAAAVFGGIAAVDGRWPLFGVMVVLGLVAAGLMLFHYWLLYRFGREPPQ
ncbi:MAG: hypothetical protein GTO46_05740 [Gemmatimonadetes bacterium]|nr:hypothetical protein [Gemmatimonadota bacterium]